MNIFIEEADVLGLSATAMTISLTDVDLALKAILTCVTILYMLYKIRGKIQEDINEKNGKDENK